MSREFHKDFRVGDAMHLPPHRGIAAQSRARSHDYATAWKQVSAVCSHAHFAYTEKTAHHPRGTMRGLPI